ncbi:MAG: UbiX family flavin prenyltransferase [Verrucomicrobia bacterium]|nr:UbiX family flavin prenyltransferase [Verrucomicrobiota bacterium]
MRLVIAATGASGAIYLQRLLHHLEGKGHELHLVMTAYAKQVIHQELGTLDIPPETRQYQEKSMMAPFASGSALFDAMVILPCSMGTVGRIASGTSDSLILRSADVFLKERRKLILVVRETPWNLIQARNVVTVMEAGASVLPAMPSFYSNPKTLEELADTVVHRVLDQLGIEAPNACRWGEERLKEKTTVS